MAEANMEVTVRPQMELLPSKDVWDQLKEVSEYALKSGFLPTSIKTKEQAGIIALKGWELGLKPMVAFSHIHVVNGKPGCSAELLLAAIKREFPQDVIRFEQMDEKGCIITSQSPGQPVEKFSFTFAEAQKAKLTNKDVWQNYATDMNRARAITRMKRSKYPQVMMGLDHTPEELETIPAEYSRVAPAPAPISEPVIASIEEKTTPAAATAEPAKEAKPEEGKHENFGPQAERKTVKEVSEDAAKKRAQLSKDIFAEVKRMGMDLNDLTETTQKMFGKGLKELTLAEMEEVLKQLKELP